MSQTSKRLEPVEYFHNHPGEVSRTVMVVEDEPCVMAFLKNALTRIGYEVLAFEDAEAALARLGRTIPGLILTDCTLPGMSGIDFIEQVKARQPEIPIMGMSGQPWKGPEMIAAGAQVFMAKPITVESLLHTVPYATSA